MRRNHMIYLCVWLVALLCSCDRTIHEYPRPSRSLVILKLFADRQPPRYYKEVVYDASFNREVVMLDTATYAEPYIPSDGYKMRITVEIYSGHIDDYTTLHTNVSRRMVERRVVYADKSALPPQDTIHVMLPDGPYYALAFADYVPESDGKQPPYTADTLYSIKGNVANYPEWGHMRSTDAGRTEFAVDFSLTEEGYPTWKENGYHPVYSREIPVYLSRPSARYRFVATDWSEFRANNSHLDKYTVKVVYDQFITAGYNLFTRRPNLFVSSYSFNAKPVWNVSEQKTEMSVMLDYIFTDYLNEDVIVASIYIYDEEGREVNHFQGVEIPLLRDHETVIRGNFLTQSRGHSEGMAIDENFEGEYVVWF